MIKSKLVMVISSIGLVAMLGVGCTTLSYEDIESKDNVSKTEIKDEVSNELANKEDNTDSNNTINNEPNSIETSNESTILSNENNINSNNEVGNYDQIEKQVEEKVNTPSCNNQLDDNSNIEDDKPLEDTNIPSQDSNKPSYDINIPSETPEDTIVSDSNYIAEIEQAIFQIVNQERVAAGLPALSYNTTMEHYARIKSKDMGDNGYFSHKDLQGNLITEQMKADGISYNAWGENIAYIQGMNNNNLIATKFMDNWMNSAGHRANILSTNFSSIGIGVYKIGNTYYATQEFYR